jgi:uncharacterized protein YfaP (DUF2135 family)
VPLVLVVAQMELPLLHDSCGSNARRYFFSQQGFESSNVIYLKEKKLFGKLLQADQYIPLNLIQVDCGNGI